MILRRITEHVKAQNWFAVGLDFFIVVVGVLIAFQIASLNETRRERILEQQYFLRLYDDMEGSLQDYASNGSWDQTRLETQELVLNSLREGVLKEEDREDFAKGLIFVGTHNPIRRRWGTIEELKSTGNIAILRDLELRALIAEVDGDYDRADRLVSRSIHQISLLREPLMKRFDPLVYGFNTSDPAEAAFDFDALAADQEFINLLAHIQLNSQAAVTFNMGHMKKIAILRDKLAQILEIEREGSAP